MAQSRYARDSDVPVAENVELLSLAQPDHHFGSTHQQFNFASWVRGTLLASDARSWNDQSVFSLFGRGVRLVWLATIYPLGFLTRLVQMSIGLPNRRTTAQQACKILGFACLTSVVLLALIALLTAALSPSFTNPPPHYMALRQAVKTSGALGRANPQDQRILIAASLYDPQGHLLRGIWSDSVLELINILGPQNTHLSIYVSDSGDDGKEALQEFSYRVHSPKTLRQADHVPIEDAPIVILPDGQPAVKRIEYLSRARNLALEPLDTQGIFDKIIYLNDIFFDPIEVAQLIFLTNSQPHDLTSQERANYRAACAMDFDNPFKFYDTLATRDYEGFSMGVPIYPFFSSSGSGESRKDVLRQTDAVRVKACWGGMVAFDARYFQQRQQSNMTLAMKPQNDAHQSRQPGFNESVIRFRSEPELDWEYSECCLIHADLADASSIDQHDQADALGQGIFMNPYIRTAYDETTFRYLWVGRRLEKLLVFVQSLINHFSALPFFNERRSLKKGEVVPKTMWVSSLADGQGAFRPQNERVQREDLHSKQSAERETKGSSEKGRWVHKDTPMSPGGFCAIHHLMVRRADPIPGHLTWETFHVPLEGEMARLNRVQMYN